MNEFNLAIIAIAVSTIAIFVSISTFALTFFWGGKIKYTKPSQIWMGYSNDEYQRPLIFFQFYSHSTGLAGKLIGSFFLDVKRGQVNQSFNFWTANIGSGYKRLAGIKVMRDGVSIDNIFQPDRSDQKFEFLEGKYELRLHSKEIKYGASKLISYSELELNREQRELIKNGKYIVFTLKADGSGYSSFAEEPSADPNKVLVNEMVEKMVSELKKSEKEDETVK